MEERYMMLEEMLRDEREAGLKEGRDAMALLAKELIRQKRYEDLERCADDKPFREQLLEEFGLAGTN